LKTLKQKLKEYGLKIALAVSTLLLTLYWLYRLVKPAPNETQRVKEVFADLSIRTKEAETLGRLQKEKIKAVKDIYTKQLEATKEIEDRDDRLAALIRLRKELD
jgi:hypothetical protein